MIDTSTNFLAGDNANVWEDIDLRIDPDPFGSLCQKNSMKKTDKSKNPLKTNAPFKWVIIDIIPSTAPITLRNDATFSNFILIVDAYSKIPNVMVWGKSQQKKLWIS